MSKYEKYDKLHEVAQIFKETASRCGIDKFMVMWGAITEDDKLPNGVVLGDGLEDSEVVDLAFMLNGRLYNMTDAKEDEQN